MFEQEMTVAIVDDDNVMTLPLVSAACADEGVHVVPIPTPDRAVAILNDQPTQLVLVDMYMLSMSGEEVVRQIRADDNLKKQRVMLFSAENETELAAAVQRCGADGYLKKGPPQEVAAKIRSLLSGA